MAAYRHSTRSYRRNSIARFFERHQPTSKAKAGKAPEQTVFSISAVPRREAYPLSRTFSSDNGEHQSRTIEPFSLASFPSSGESCPPLRRLSNLVPTSSTRQHRGRESWGRVRANFGFVFSHRGSIPQTVKILGWRDGRLDLCPAMDAAILNCR